MGYRTLQTDDLKLTITNIYSETVVVVSAKLTPGQTKTVPLRYVLENYQRALDLSDLVNSHKIQVVFNNQAYDYTNLGPMTPAYLANLSTPSAPAYGQFVSGLAADLPLATEVPLGFAYFCTDTGALNINGAAGWVVK